MAMAVTQTKNPPSQPTKARQRWTEGGRRSGSKKAMPVVVMLDTIST